MVLACLTMLLLAFMLLLSFALARAIHERIRIQAHADAAAFSLATIEARALNVIAYQNRAISASVVTMMSVHAWMALASLNVRIAQAVQQTFGEIRSAEAALCPPPPAPPTPHCAHRNRARQNAERFELWGSPPSPYLQNQVAKIRNLLDDRFDGTIAALYAGARTIYQRQGLVLTKVLDEIGPDALSAGGVLHRLKQVNLPEPQAVYAKYGSDFADINQKELGCAIEGLAVNPQCDRFYGAASAPPLPRDDAVRSVMARNAANAARAQFEASCGNEPRNFTAAKAVWPPAVSPTRKCAKALGVLQPNHMPGHDTPNLFDHWLRSATGSAGVVTLDFLVDAYARVVDDIQTPTDDANVAERMVSQVRNGVDATESRVEVHDWGCSAIANPYTSTATIVNSTNSGSLFAWDAVGIHSSASFQMHMPCYINTATGSVVSAVSPELACVGGESFLNTHDLAVGHDKFHGICFDNSGLCFVGFRSDPREAADYGQPSVYVAVRQPLSPGSFRPWELNATKRATMKVGPGLEARLELGPRYGSLGSDMAYAVSKAKVYYHELANPYGGEAYYVQSDDASDNGYDNSSVSVAGVSVGINGDWKRPPNLFDPFWRAKLHPFKKLAGLADHEKQRALTTAGDSQGAELVRLIVAD
jgi:hypothetical protein